MAERRTQRSYRNRGSIPALLFLAALLLFPFARPAAAEQMVLKVRHDHAFGSCRGDLVLDEDGVRYQTDHTKDARNWRYQDIQQFQVEDGTRLKIYTYEDRKWRLGADKTFAFEVEDREITAEQVYEFLQARTERPIAAWLVPSEIGTVLFEFAVKHLGSGSQGQIKFTDQQVVFETEKKEASRTWRYEDLESISSAGIYDLALATYEQHRFGYASRRVYNFQLKRALPADIYDTLWRFVNEKKGLGVLDERPLRQQPQ
ncbi:MAG: hypothetical protein HY649_08105 [Acidobacteria bacterium]|nr:hypothetical protein [Acidobacteriota bacterium]